MNVHIFTPIIYDDVVPDDEWRMLRDQLIREGIRLGVWAAERFKFIVSGRC